MVYSLSTVLAVARTHCFYQPDLKYPPNGEIVDKIVKEAAAGGHVEEKLSAWPLLHKKPL